MAYKVALPPVLGPEPSESLTAAAIYPVSPIPEEPVTLDTTGCRPTLERPPLPTDWAASLPDLGPKSVGPFTSCGLCGTGTWVRYGQAPRCRDCARDPKTAAVRLYLRALRRRWELSAQGAGADRSAIEDTYQAITKLVDEVGEPLASTLCRQWARAWRRETGLNPWTGEREPRGSREPGS